MSIHYYKHNYKKHFMFLKTPTATERSAKGDTLVSPHSIQSHNLTSTLTITCILHPPWWGVGIKLTFSWVFPPQSVLYYGLRGLIVTKKFSKYSFGRQSIEYTRGLATRALKRSNFSPFSSATVFMASDERTVNVLLKLLNNSTCKKLGLVKFCIGKLTVSSVNRCKFYAR
jgi:hypothetical protein